MEGESEGEDEATRVESAPWVMTTSRAREALDLLNEAKVDATVSNEADWSQRETFEVTHPVTGGGGVGSSLGLVSDQNVNVREESLELDLEELRDEWSRQVEDDGFTPRRGSLGDLDGGFDTVGEKVAFNVKVFGAGQELLDLWFGEVVWGKRLGSSESSDEGSVVARDDDGTGAGFGRGGLDLVGRLDIFGVVG